MDIHLRDAAGGRVRPAAWPGEPGAAASDAGTGEAAAGAAVTALYQAHAPRLIGLAYLMLGDRGNAALTVARRVHLPVPGRCPAGGPGPGPAGALGQAHRHT